MTILNNVKGTKSQYWKRDLSTKITINDEAIYKCNRLSMWYRYKGYAFRYEEIYFYLGLREYIMEKEYTEIVNDIKSKVGTKDFWQILKDAENWYKKEENRTAFYKWNSGVIRS